MNQKLDKNNMSNSKESLMKIIASLFIFLISAQFLMAAEILDVPTSNANAEAIQRVVDGGYMLLGNNQSFQPDEPVKRQDMAVAIDKILQESDKQKGSLSPLQIQELVKLSNSYKDVLAGNESDLNKLKQTYGKVEKEQDALNFEYNAKIEELKQEIKATQEHANQNDFYLILGGLGIAGLLALTK